MTTQEAIEKYRDDIAPYMRGDANEAVYNVIVDAAEKWAAIEWAGRDISEHSEELKMDIHCIQSLIWQLLAEYRASQEESK